MNTRQKALRTGAIFIAVLIVAGLLLLYKGNDAVAIGMEKKEGILTAEQVKMSFDSVSGRLLKEAVKEGDTVKAGDVIMELDGYGPLDRAHEGADCAARRADPLDGRHAGGQLPEG